MALVVSMPPLNRDDGSCVHYFDCDKVPAVCLRCGAEKPMVTLYLPSSSFRRSYQVPGEAEYNRDLNATIRDYYYQINGVDR